MRIMFVARAINRMAGGVERMVTMLVNDLVARDHEVDLLTWDLNSAESFYPIDARVTWHRLNLGDPQLPARPTLMAKRAHTIRKLIREKKPAAIVCFQDGPFVAIRGYTLGLPIPIIAAERNAPNRFEYVSAARYQGLIFHSFRFAARITIQFDSYRAFYPGFLQSRIVCIPNPVQLPARRARPDVSGPQSRYRLLSVGRLGFQKNYSVLIQAFAGLATRYPEWDLVIVGDGEERAALETLVKARGLHGRVILPGTTKCITGWYASSHLFCLPSLWEGFPNALAEALAHGLPAVGFAECAGVRDLIRHGRNGILAEGNDDVRCLALGLEKVMSNAGLRGSMGSEAILSVKAYSPERVFSSWEHLLIEVGREGSFLH